MAIRRFGEHPRDYIGQGRAFVASSACRWTAEPDDLRCYQLHLASLCAS